MGVFPKLVVVKLDRIIILIRFFQLMGFTDLFYFTGWCKSWSFYCPAAQIGRRSTCFARAFELKLAPFVSNDLGKTKRAQLMFIWTGDLEVGDMTVAFSHETPQPAH